MIAFANSESNIVNEDTLKTYPVGMNAGFINGQIAKFWGNKYRWVGYDIAAYWNKNLMAPKDIVAVVSEWENYPYIIVERKLLNKEYEAIAMEEFNMFHVCYIMNKDEMHNPLKLEKLHRLLDVCGKKYDMKDTKVLTNFLDSLSIYLHFSASEFNTTVFSFLAQNSNRTKSVGVSEYSRDYNEFLEKS